MGVAVRIAIVFLSMLAPVALACCSGSGPTAPTSAPSPESPLKAGVYRLTLLSLAGTQGCRGGSQPGLGPLGSAALELQVQAQEREWIGRLRTAGRGDFQLTLREDGIAVTGTMRGRADHSSTSGATPGSIEFSQPATLNGSVVANAPVRIFGLVNGELVYDEGVGGRVTCTSATWTLESTGQI